MRTTFFLILAAGIIAACSADASTAATAPFVGTWNLRTLGGRPLPMTCLPINCPAYSQVATLGIRIDILGSALSLTEGGIWSEQLTLSVVTVTGTFNQPQTIHGAYVRTGASVHLTATSNPEYMDCEIIADALTCGDGKARYTR
jgi:hypothetical protein